MEIALELLNEYTSKLTAFDINSITCSALRNRAKQIIGLTCRVGRHMAGNLHFIPVRSDTLSS